MCKKTSTIAKKPQKEERDGEWLYKKLRYLDGITGNKIMGIQMDRENQS